MSLDLCVARFENGNLFATQKCLIPGSILSKVGRAGQWAKCVFYAFGRENIKNYSICQIYPREGDHNSVCFLDTTVCRFVTSIQDEFILDSVEPLYAGEVKLNQLYVSVYLSPVKWLQQLNRISKSALKIFIKTLLQSFNISSKCVIQCLELQKKGIEFIVLTVKNGEDNGNFIITSNTVIQVENISLAPCSLKKNSVRICLRPLTEARLQLNELLAVHQIHSGFKCAVNLNTNALIIGPTGSGKTTLIESFLKETRCNVFRIESSDVVRQYPGETEKRLKHIFRTAQSFEKFSKTKEHIVILLEDIHILCPKLTNTTKSLESGANFMRITTQLMSLVDELFSHKCRIFCLATTSSMDSLNELVRRPGRFEKEIYVASLSEYDRKNAVKLFLKHYLPEDYVSESLLQMVSKHTQGYAIADIDLLCRNAIQSALTKPSENLELAMKECLKQRQPTSLLSSEVTAYKTSKTFSDIGGLTKMRKILETSVLAGLKHEATFCRFGLALPRGVLLYGPPGCAKTTVAKCLANEANMTLIPTSAAEVYSPYVGCAEAFISKIFDTARKNAPCLIFLDEIDALVGRRALSSSSSNDVQTRILSTLLTEMEGIICSSNFQKETRAHILVVAATNRPDMVDDALIRPGRFDKLIHVPAPDSFSRHSILSLYKQQMPISDDVDLNRITKLTENYSGADICKLCNEAALQAFQRDLDTDVILNEDFEKVFVTLKSSLTEAQINYFYQYETRFLK